MSAANAIDGAHRLNQIDPIPIPNPHLNDAIQAHGFCRSFQALKRTDTRNRGRLSTSVLKVARCG
ncbi:MAG: hypothetical protein P8N76_12465 [Pirellulaceae bacterium]|nr:hypothetical protein [Planctomycetaceae bacterium]MDG2382475.1 hypothetical protein [Pirellulaceae bacterium]